MHIATGYDITLTGKCSLGSVIKWGGGVCAWCLIIQVYVAE